METTTSKYKYLNLLLSVDLIAQIVELHFQTTNVAVYVKPVTPTDEISNRTSFAVALFNRNLKLTVRPPEWTSLALNLCVERNVFIV